MLYEFLNLIFLKLMIPSILQPIHLFLDKISLNILYKCIVLVFVVLPKSPVIHSKFYLNDIIKKCYDIFVDLIRFLTAIV